MACGNRLELSPKTRTGICGKYMNLPIPDLKSACGESNSSPEAWRVNGRMSRVTADYFHPSGFAFDFSSPLARLGLGHSVMTKMPT
jgi:hypothetical protein